MFRLVVGFRRALMLRRRRLVRMRGRRIGRAFRAVRVAGSRHIRFGRRTGLIHRAWRTIVPVVVGRSCIVSDRPVR